MPSAVSTGETIGRRLLEIVVYDRCCRIGGTLTLDDLAETSEIGDWKMPDFKPACAYAASQGWLIVETRHGGVEGGLIVQTSNLSRVSGASRSACKLVQTPLCVRSDVIRPIEFDGNRQGFHLLQQIEERFGGGYAVRRRDGGFFVISSW